MVPAPSSGLSGEITGLLRAWSGGDDGALPKVVELVYPELRDIARRCLSGERPHHTIQATALVHEAYVRLVDIPLPAPLCTADVKTLAAASRGCTGADLKAIIEDGKLQFAYDLHNGEDCRHVEQYFLNAIKVARQNRAKYSEAEARPNR